MSAQRQGWRVLVVEDEPLIAMDIEMTLRGIGCEVVGPVQRVEPAIGSIAGERFDVAVLDINLAGEMVFPVADALAARRIPFVFLTGYGRDTVPERFRDRPLFRKPYSSRTMLQMLQTATAA